MINNSINELITNELISQLNKKMEEIVIEGLQRKGFKFENKKELENFIQLNCKCEDRVDIKQKTYFVNDTPFLLHDYKEIQPNFNLDHSIDREFKMVANYGSYLYL